MADKLRNELEVELGGEVRTMRAKFTVMRDIERDLGVSILKLLTVQFAGGDLSITQAAIIIWHGLRGFDDKRLTLEQVGDAIMEKGLPEFVNVVSDFLSLSMQGVSLGKPKAAA